MDIHKNFDGTNNTKSKISNILLSPQKIQDLNKANLDRLDHKKLWISITKISVSFTNRLET